MFNWPCKYKIFTASKEAGSITRKSAPWDKFLRNTKSINSRKVAPVASFRAPFHIFTKRLSKKKKSSSTIVHNAVGGTCQIRRWPRAVLRHRSVWACGTCKVDLYYNMLNEFIMTSDMTEGCWIELQMLRTRLSSRPEHSISVLLIRVVTVIIGQRFWS